MSTEQRPKPAPVTFDNRKSERFSEIKLTLKFITPMFGGGTTTRKAGEGSQFKDCDEVTPVRGASIRGQLRFWWRATSGAWCKDIKDMREREDALFGRAAKTVDGESRGPGAVGLLVDSKGLGQPEPRRIMTFERGYAQALDNARGLAYGAFSLAPQREDANRGHTTPGVLHEFRSTSAFSLIITCPEKDREELLLALSAWVAFGGLGGRTSRGFGRIADAADSRELYGANEVLAKVKAKGNALVSDVPHLSADERHYVHAPMDHNGALFELQWFRQGRGTGGRNKGEQKNRPGRSRWPDADYIRKITNRSDPNHRQPLTSVEKFSKAMFGLPIVFHFQSKSDPTDQSLQPHRADGKRMERMPSALRIAPQEDGKTWFVALQGVCPAAVSLRDETHRQFELTDDERKTLQNYAIRNGGHDALFSDVDPLVSFLNYVSGR